MFGRIDNFKPDKNEINLDDFRPNSNLYLDAIGSGTLEYCEVNHKATKSLIPNKSFPANKIDWKWTQNHSFSENCAKEE